MEKICEYCGKSFFVETYRENTGRFCSHSCVAKWQVKLKGFGLNTRFTRIKLLGNKYAEGSTPWNKGLKGYSLSGDFKGLKGENNPAWVEPIKLKCETCGSIFYRKPWYLKGNHKGRFCSPLCRNQYFKNSGQLMKMAMEAHKIPTKAERRFIRLCKKYSFPFKFVGDGKYWIGRVNPDFVWEQKHIAIEVMSRYHHNFFRLFTYGKILPWFKTPCGRKELLEKNGWKCIILPDNFKEAKALREVLRYCPLQRNLLALV